eukprot:6826090-Prymnesium_polylepis.1
MGRALSSFARVRAGYPVHAGRRAQLVRSVWLLEEQVGRGEGQGPADRDQQRPSCDDWHHGLPRRAEGA